jgi:hypothetical protein
MLFKIVFFPEKEHFEFEGGLEVRAYYDPEDTPRTVYVAGSKIRLIVYLHECVHAVRDRVLPECIGLYFDILFDLVSLIFIPSSYTKEKGLINSFKETWKDYRIQGEVAQIEGGDLEDEEIG